MGKPMTDLEKRILADVIKSKLLAKDSGERFVGHYYGNEPNAVRNAIPANMEGLEDPKARPTALQSFTLRSIPAYLGVLAEIEANSNITVDELVDTTSEAAIQSKTRAGARLKEVLPKKNADGSWEFNYDEFERFFYNNTKKLYEKIYDLHKRMEKMNLYEKYAACMKYYVLTDGIFDGYCQQFTSSPFKSELSNLKKEIGELMDKIQALSNAFSTPASVVEKLALVAKQWDSPEINRDNSAKDIVVYSLSPSYNSRHILSEVIEGSRNGNTDPKKVEASVTNNALAALNMNEKFKSDKIGILRYLTEFERSVLAIDPSLCDRVIIDHVVDKETGFLSNTDVFYIDEEGKKIDLGLEKDINQDNMENAIRIKKDIYKVLLNEERYAGLSESYKKRMQSFLSEDPKVNFAVMICETGAEAFEEISDDIKNAQDADTSDKYQALVAAVKKVNAAYNEVMEVPCVDTNNELKEALEAVNKAGLDYKAYCEANAGQPWAAAGLELSGKVADAVAAHNNQCARLTKTTKYQYGDGIERTGDILTLGVIKAYLDIKQAGLKTAENRAETEADGLVVNKHREDVELGETRKIRDEINANITNILGRGLADSLAILKSGDEFGPSEVNEDRVLNMLTNVYLKLKTKALKEEGEKDPSANLKSVLESKGIKFDDTLDLALVFPEASDAVNEVFDYTKLNTIEANLYDEKTSVEFLNHLHEEIKKTEAYKYFTKNKVAAAELAAGGADSEYIDQAMRQEFLNILFVRTEHDYDKTSLEAERNSYIDANWYKYSKDINLKNELIGILKEEIATRPEVDLSRPIFAQYARHIAESLEAKKDRLAELGLDTQLVDAFVNNVNRYNNNMNKMNQSGAIETLADIEKTYNEIYNFGFNVLDNPADLIQADYRVLNMAKEGTDNVAQYDELSAQSIKEYNATKLLRVYGDILTKTYIEDAIHPEIAKLLEKLEAAPKDNNSKTAYENVVKAASYLKKVTEEVIADDKPENLDKAGFDLYKDALDNLNRKIKIYSAGNPAASERRSTVHETDKFLAGKLKPVSEAGKLIVSDADTKVAIDQARAKNEEAKVEESKYNKSSVLDYYDKSIDTVKGFKRYVKDYRDELKTETAEEKIDKFIEKYEYVAVRLRKLQEVNKDGSYKVFDEDLRVATLNSFRDLRDMADDLRAYIKYNYKPNECEVVVSTSKNIVESFDNDINAILDGTLYGVTEPRNVKKHITEIEKVHTALTKTKRWGDGSSPEFKKLLDDLSSLKQEMKRDKRTESGVKVYVTKLEKVREAAKDYLRRKRYINDGNTRSTTRIAETDKLLKYLDTIVPMVKDEATANSYVNRFGKLAYNKEVLVASMAMIERLDNKRSEIDKLVAGPYKKVSELAIGAREKLVDFILKGMPKDGFPEGDERNNQIKDCIATLILEKRIKYERMTETEKHIPNSSPARYIEPVIINKIRELEQANPENTDHIYDSMINQIKDYDSIKASYLKPARIYALLMDEKGGVDDLYMSDLSNAIVRRQGNHGHEVAHEEHNQARNHENGLVNG